MTTIVAVKKGNRICIGSDGLTTCGSKKEVSGLHVKAPSKLLAIGENIVGVSGHASWCLILRDHFAKQSCIPVWQTPNEIFLVFKEMHELLKERYFLTPPCLDFVPFESSEFSVIIANLSGIFEVDYQRVVRQYKKYNAIGTGESFAVGALEATYSLEDDPEVLARDALRASVHFDLRSQEPFELRTINLKN